MTATVYKYEDWAGGDGAFLTAMHSGEVFEVDEEMFMYWLEVLPPVYMSRRVTLPNGREVKASFGFAEGAEPVTAFWKERSDGAVHHFGCRTNTMNRPW